ncbi:uncharacterized protein LOC143510193 isoform X2 [Brachyhypopomus gauderio]
MDELIDELFYFLKDENDFSSDLPPLEGTWKNARWLKPSKPTWTKLRSLAPCIRNFEEQYSGKPKQETHDTNPMKAPVNKIDMDRIKSNMDEIIDELFFLKDENDPDPPLEGTWKNARWLRTLKRPWTKLRSLAPCIRNSWMRLMSQLTSRSTFGNKCSG